MGIWNRAEGGAACFYYFSRCVKREFKSGCALGYNYIEISAILKTSGKWWVHTSTCKCHCRCAACIVRLWNLVCWRLKDKKAKFVLCTWLEGNVALTFIYWCIVQFSCVINATTTAIFKSGCEARCSSWSSSAWLRKCELQGSDCQSHGCLACYFFCFSPPHSELY